MEESVFDPSFDSTMPVYGVGDESVFDPSGGGGGGGGSTDLLKSIGNILSGKSGSMSQLAGLGGLGALINKFGGSGSSGPTGYQGKIPKYTASRSQLPIPRSTSQSAYPQMPPNMMAGLGRPGMMGRRPAQAQYNPFQQSMAAPARRPGSGGVSYFSPMRYLKPGESPEANTSQPAMQPYASAEMGRNPYLAKNLMQEKIGIGDFMRQQSSGAKQPQASTASGGDSMTMEYTPQDLARSQYLNNLNPNFRADRANSMNQMAAAAPKLGNLGQALNYAAGGMAQGGLGSLGHYSDGGRLLRGPGDGVSDSIPATIGDKQPARLADGECVIPARIVSEIGNGSTEAGARKLYAMMDRIQKARKKTLKNVAANTKADKHLPA